MPIGQNRALLLHDYLHQSARRLPDKIALVHQGERLTYAEIEARSSALAHALIQRGVRRGDRVVVFAHNTVETVVSFWAILKANAVVSIVSPLTKSAKLAYLLNDCRASALITDGQLTPVFAPAAAASPHLSAILVSGELDATLLSWLHGVASFAAALEGERRDRPPLRRSIDIDLAAIIYTSGSTGEPKGVMLTHRNMLTAATSITTYLESVEDDIILCALPLAFDYGLYQMIMATRTGSRLVLERSFVYPAQVLKVMVEEAVTGFPGVPTMFATLAEMKSAARGDLAFSMIRYVTNTAAALPVKHILALKDLFPAAKIFSMYGLTECKRCTYLPPEDLDRKPASVGLAIPNTELWIVDENDARCGPGEVGQLVIRGATVMRGYWDKPEATAKKLRPGPLPGEMVLYTGDYCTLDEEGYLYFVARMDDVIKSRGEKVPPKEVEGVIANLDGVKEVAVIGVPDEILGQAVKAFVVLEQGVTLTAKDVLAECHKKLESFMVPKVIEFLAELPKTSTGKIKKTGLS
jgi:amino acid adenylation domain-containing protein